VRPGHISAGLIAMALGQATAGYPELEQSRSDADRQRELEEARRQSAAIEVRSESRQVRRARERRWAKIGSRK
jgi:hypothetical protein